MEEDKTRDRYERSCVKVVVIATGDVISTSGDSTENRLPKDYFGF